MGGAGIAACARTRSCSENGENLAGHALAICLSMFNQEVSEYGFVYGSKR